MKRSYDTIAGVYDVLAGIFIGKALRDAQIYLVQFIPAGANVLIVGGGTGWILEEIAGKHTNRLKIDYLDISANMISRARKRYAGQNNVNFITQSAEDEFTGADYDVILTPFFFDNFQEATMRSIFKKLDQKLNPNGLWLFADFQVKGKHRFLQKGMLWVMYAFFRVICNVEAKHLPDTTAQFKQHRYKVTNSTIFKKGFIISTVYQKR